jgi:hypothetical protein
VRDADTGTRVRLVSAGFLFRDLARFGRDER